MFIQQPSTSASFGLPPFDAPVLSHLWFVLLFAGLLTLPPALEQGCLKTRETVQVFKAFPLQAIAFSLLQASPSPVPRDRLKETVKLQVSVAGFNKKN